MDGFRYLRGTTLLELMASISVLTIALIMGIPAFNTLRINLQRSGASTELLISFALARSEAARRGVPVTVCASTDGLTCDAAQTPDWDNGWILFTDADLDKTVESGTDVIIQATHYDHPRFSMTPECVSGSCTTAKGVTFRDNGYPVESDIGRFRYADTGQYQLLTLNYIGRAEVTATGTP